MKKFISLVLGIAILLYGFCYISKNGSESLPSIDEYLEYLEKASDSVHEKLSILKEKYSEVEEWVVSFISKGE